MTITEGKQQTSLQLIDVFFRSCKIGFPLLGLSVLLALAVPLFVVAPTDKMLTAKLTFTALGLLFGILQVFLGVLLALVGVTIDYDVDATMGPAKIRLASASPGILLLLVGNLLFAFSLMREFEVSESKTMPALQVEDGARIETGVDPIGPGGPM